MVSVSFEKAMPIFVMGLPSALSQNGGVEFHLFHCAMFSGYCPKKCV